MDKAYTIKELLEQYPEPPIKASALHKAINRGTLDASRPLVGERFVHRLPWLLNEDVFLAWRDKHLKRTGRA